MLSCTRSKLASWALEPQKTAITRSKASLKTLRSRLGTKGAFARRHSKSSSTSSARVAPADSDCDGEPHKPVLLQEVLKYFSDVKIGSFVDGTLGAGGHALAVLSAHPETAQFWGLDVDQEAHDVAQPRLLSAQKVQHWSCQLKFGRFNYSQMGTAIQTKDLKTKADAILLDLGTSSMQMDRADRGFSFTRDGPLDMRMGISSSMSAEQMVNTWPEAELARVFRVYGEERHWRAYASRVVDAREKAPIRTTHQLCAALGHIGKRKAARKQIHPATRVFQAIRIAVNDELSHLEKAVPECIDCLASRGRLAIISFHSLEDRIVKQAFLKASGKELSYVVSDLQPDIPVLGRILTRKPVVPSAAEEFENPRSRSAKLRVFERC